MRPCILIPIFCYTCLYGWSQENTGVPKMNVQEVRKKNLPNLAVAVTGTVIASDVLHIYLQDNTGALGIIRAGLPKPINVGERLEVVGTTTQAGPALGLAGLSLTRLGTAPLPAAEPHSAEALAKKKANSQMVRVSGTVHEAGVDGGMSLLQVQAGSTSFLALWPKDSATPRQDLLDAEVTLVGAASPLFDNYGVRSGFRLVLGSSSREHLQITKPGSENPFDLPLCTIASLSGIESHENTRRKLRGVVTYWSDAGWFHFQDESGHARGNNAHFIPRGIGWPYRTARSEPILKPGDEIEVVGMPVLIPTGEISISRCEWRIVGPGQTPVFAPIQPANIKGHKFDGQAASVTGRVVDTSITTDYQGFSVHTLWLESGQMPFTAIIQKRKAGTFPVKAGDHVRLEGVLATSPGVVGRGLFRMNLNDFSDIHHVPSPPSWQSIELLRWLLVVIAALSLAGFWIFLLRRQVASQTSQLRKSATLLEEQLEKERELGEMKSRFVFTVSHEFRNPLAAILSCSDVLQRLKDRMTPEDHERQIVGIQQNVRRMADTMEEVLLFGRAESGRLSCNPRPLDVKTFCQDAVDHIRSAGNEHSLIQLSVHEPLPVLMMDDALLGHILGNLLGNAVKYSPENVEVKLGVWFESAELIIRIRDSGIGIPSEDRRHIFEPFHRGTNVGQTTGSGLGLAIADRCARAHGGSITCEQPDDSGTLFVLRIPCSPAA